MHKFKRQLLVRFCNLIGKTISVLQAPKDEGYKFKSFFFFLTDPWCLLSSKKKRKQFGRKTNNKMKVIHLKNSNNIRSLQKFMPNLKTKFYIVPKNIY